MPDERDTNMPLVSVVTPCRNAERFLRATLDAILGQTYANIEICVADDGSTDGSRDVLRAYEPRVKWAPSRGKGQSAAVNTAFGMSSGGLINFHDADDLMAPDKVARQVEAALADPGAVIYGPWRLVWMRGAEVERVDERQTDPVPADEDMLDMQLRGWFCPAHSYLWPRALVENLGGWDESLYADKDADFAMRALVAGARFTYCGGSWVDYVQHAGPRASLKRTASTLRSRARVVRKITRLLEERGDLDKYRDAIAWRYDDSVRDHWEACPATAAWCAREARRVSGKPPAVGRLHYRLVYRLLGVAAAEGLATAKRRVLGAW